MSGNIPEQPTASTPEEIREWLDYALDSSRRDELNEALSNQQSIDSDESLAQAGENMAMAKAFLRGVEEQRVKNKKPFLDAGRAVDKWVDRFLVAFEERVDVVQGKMDLYGREKLAQAQAAARAARLAAEAELHRQAAAVAASMRQGTAPTQEQVDAAETVVEHVRAATEVENAKPSEHTRVRGIYGTAVSLHTNWTWRVVNADLIPREFMMPNAARINLARKAKDASGKPVAVIPGIEWVPSHSMRTHGT